MSLLSEDMQKKALLKIQLATSKNRDGFFLRVMAKLLKKQGNLVNRVEKTTQKWMDTRHLVWAQYNKHIKEFAHDVDASDRGHDYDLVLCHDSKAINVAVKSAKKNNAVLGFDLVELTFANRRNFKPGLITRWKLRRAESKIAKAKFMISGDRYLTQEFQTRHPDTDPVLILNGQDATFPKIKKSLRQRISDDTQRPIVVFIGVIAALRGIEQIIESFSQIKLDALLVLVGPSNAKFSKKMQEKIVNVGLSGRAYVLGGVEQDEVIPLASTATIGISPIMAETGNAGLVLNNRLFQYLAAGLPIVSTNVPGAGGFIKKHKIGFVYEENDVESLARAIEDALDQTRNNPELMKQVIKTAKQYSWADQQKRLKQYIHSIEQNVGY